MKLKKSFYSLILCLFLLFFAIFVRVLDSQKTVSTWSGGVEKYNVTLSDFAGRAYGEIYGEN